MIACVCDDRGGLGVSGLQFSSSSSVKLLSMKSTCSTSPFTTDGRTATKRRDKKKEEKRRTLNACCMLYAPFLFLQCVSHWVPLGISSKVFLSSSSLCCSRVISINRKDLSEKSSADWKETGRMSQCARRAR